MYEQHSKAAPSQSPDATLHTGLQGFYKIEAIQPDGTVRVLADWFENLITDIGLNRWGTGGTVQFCRVGTGTAQPTNGDTDLQAPIASTGTNSSANDTAQPTPPYFITLARTFTFTQGAVVGNISEVGVGWAASGATLWSRARIKDGGGVDTTITVTAIEQLSISYQLRLNIVTPDVVTTPTIGGVVTTVTLRPAQVTAAGWATVTGGPASALDSAYAGAQVSTYGAGTAYSGAIGPVTGSPSGTAGVASSKGQTVAYGNNNLYNDVTYVWAIANGNVGGVAAALVAASNGGSWQAGFAPAIAKDNTKTLSLVFRFSWGRT